MTDAAVDDALTDAARLHRRAASGFDARVRAVGAGQWGLPTPCEDWDVRALVAHIVDEQLWTAPLLDGGTVEGVGPSIPADPLGDDPVGAWERSSADALAGVARTDPEAIVHLSFGDVPAREYVMQLFADLLVHGWDLARATGRDERLDPELVAACAAWFDANEDLYRGAGVIGARAEGAGSGDPQRSLLARFGRTP